MIAYVVIGCTLVLGLTCFAVGLYFGFGLIVRFVAFVCSMVVVVSFLVLIYCYFGQFVL